MARKRQPHEDFICRRCLCPCNPPGGDPRHLGGGQGMRACKKDPAPILRADYEAEMDAFAQAATYAIRRRL